MSGLMRVKNNNFILLAIPLTFVTRGGATLAYSWRLKRKRLDKVSLVQLDHAFLLLSLKSVVYFLGVGSIGKNRSAECQVADISIGGKINGWMLNGRIGRLAEFHLSEKVKRQRGSISRKLKNRIIKWPKNLMTEKFNARKLFSRKIKLPKNPLAENKWQKVDL